MRVLVVDDGSLGQLLVTLFRGQEDTAHVAESTAGALELLAVITFDVVCLDLGLPDTHKYGGYGGVAQAIRAHHCNTLIIMSGVADDILIKTAASVKGCALQKPFDFDTLKTLIGETTT
jgi:DNA-binding response OmpR family regulator